MTECEWLDRGFHDHRPRLHSVASHILGSAADADDAVQEAWLRLHRTDPATIDNPAGWLSTVVARVSIDMRRARRRRPRPGLPADEVPHAGKEPAAGDPEHEVALDDSVAGALVVVMESLSPAQRLAFVLHEGFAVPFDSIAAVLACSPEAARQHASRARRQVRSCASAGHPRGARHRQVVSAFREAARNGDLRPLAAVLYTRQSARVAMPGYSTIRPDRS